LFSAPLFVYGNWSAYDELSDGIELTEELAMRQLGEMLRMRERGVRFDAYLMDAFWFATDGGYREWRRPHWPDGPDRWLEACRENEILPGLWFTVNTLCHLDPAPKWRDSVDAKGWGMCLFEGGFLQDFLEILNYWFERGIRLFKFDFAELSALPAGLEGSLSAAEARARNLAALRAMLSEFRARHPDAILLAFNGFDESECMDRTNRPLQRYIDPAWLELFDSIYSGDPRPADLPEVDFWRSVDLYADHMTRVFEFSGIPLDRIDNCGFMAGPTGTCYWRGKAGWQRMLLLSLARGGRIHVAYGDLSQFSNEDADWWAKAQALYAPSMVSDGTVSWGGLPGKGEIYGWRSLRQDGELFTVVNPALAPTDIALPDAGDWSAVAHDQGFEPVVIGNRLRIGGGQMVVLSRGSAEPVLSVEEGSRAISAKSIFSSENSVRSPLVLGWLLPKMRGDKRGVRLVTTNQPGQYDLRKTPFSSSTVRRAHQASPENVVVQDGFTEFEFGQVGPDALTLIVWQTDAAGQTVRTFPTPERVWIFAVEIQIGSETIVLPSKPDRPVWSGMSWSAFTLPVDMPRGALTVRVRSSHQSPVELGASILLQ
jgi:hypothetical protein